MSNLNDDFFKRIGFDITKEPFVKQRVSGKITVNKNYIRDGSGRYEGYIIVAPKVKTVNTVDELNAWLASG